ncbi:MAG: M15 family metallopeptidase [Treponema sp.]|jgi:LAS superfamily LD-carboxypeptidase LdcB|nr:M15 family metallopeptidase [Treponema sp.]
MSRSEVSKNSLPALPPTSNPSPELQKTGPVDVVSNAECADCCDKIKLVPVNLPGKGDTYLDESFAPKVQSMIDNAKANGVDVIFVSGYRTPEEQALLRKNPRAITPAENSLHSCGFAVDITRDLWADKSKLDIVREAAEKAGLRWGGDFRKYDPPHFYADPPIERKQAIKCAEEQYNKIK